MNQWLQALILVVVLVVLIYGGIRFARIVMENVDKQVQKNQEASKANSNPKKKTSKKNRR